MTAASHTGWWIVAGCGAFVVVLGAVTTSRWALRTAAALGDLDAPLRPAAVPVGDSAR